MRRHDPAGRIAPDGGGTSSLSSRIPAAIAVAIGTIAIAAVFLGVPGLTSVISDRVPVAANTGLGLILLGVALHLRAGEHRERDRAGVAAALAAALLGALSLASLVLGWQPGIDRWLFPSPPGASEMSPQTATAFVLLGVALATARTRHGWIAVRAAAAIVLGIVLINVLDVAYGASGGTILGRYTQMAMPTAIAVGAVAVGVALLDPRHSIVDQIRDPGSVGTLTRRLLVAALAVPFVVGYLRLVGQRAGLYDSAYGVALTTAVTTVLFAIAIRITGRALERIEAQKEAAEAERRKAEEELAAAQAEIADLWNDAPIGYHSLDADGRFVHVNQTELAMLGYTRDEMGRMAFIDLLTDEGRDRFRETFPRFRAEGVVRDVDFELRRRDGSLVPVRVSATAVRDRDGRFLASRSAVQDISQLRETEVARERAREAAEAANAAKSQFLSRMSHELRTPLNSVLGFAQLLEADELTPEQRDSVAYIRRAGTHLLELINEILDISRIEQGRLSISPEPVVVRESLEEVCSFVAPMAAGRGIEIEADRIACAEPVVLADRQRLRQVLLNLLTNAVKYNRDHGHVRVGCLPADAGTVRITVTDTGPGIPPGSQHRVFEPFDRLGAEATEIEGSGMGLALSRALARAMGGDLGFESEVGRGSTFWISLPQAPAPPDAPPAPPSVDGHAADVGEARLERATSREASRVT